MDRIPIYTPVAGLEALAGSAVYLNIPHGMQVNSDKRQRKTINYFSIVREMLRTRVFGERFK